LAATAELAGGDVTFLLDEVLPRFDVREHHSTVIKAPAQRVYAALWATDFSRSPVIRLLLGLRALPAILVGTLKDPRGAVSRRAAGRAGRAQRAALTLRWAVAERFTVLGDDPPRELVLGLVGAFWRLRGGLRRVDADAFRGPQPPGTARTAWSFHVAQRADGSSVLSTETRVECADAASRWRFRLYWLVVRPGSGLIRRAMLRAIRRAAEG
jgi:hypothetical protein